MSCPGVTLNGHCIPIYEVELRWPGPDPDPKLRIFDDLRILVTLNRGIAAINDHHLRDHLSQALQSAAKTLSLPDGVKLGDGLFKEKKAMNLAE